MKRAEKGLFLAGWVVMLCTLVFLLLVGFTPVKQEIYRPFLYSAMGELGYEVISQQRSNGSTTLNFRVPEGETVDEARFREILAQAHEQAQARFVGMVQRAGVAAVSVGMLCFLGSALVGRLRQRKQTREESSKKRQRRKQAPSPATPSPGTMGRQFSPVPTRQPAAPWEELVWRIERSLSLVGDPSKREELESQLLELKEEGKRKKRTSKARYLLESLEIALKPSPKKERSAGQAQKNGSMPRNEPSRGRAVAELLPIEEFIPSELNPQLIKEVLVRGFLRPGSRKRYLQGGYTSLEDVQRRVPFSPREVEEGVEWLLKVGVLAERPRKKQGRELLSCNIHMNGAGEPGSSIIVAVRRAAYRLTKLQ